MRIVKGILFWLVSCTWGCPMTLLGALVALAMLLTGHRPHRFGPLVWFEAGRNWGGSEYGAFFVVERGAGEGLKCHEAGHSVQNLIFGPLTPVLVSVPSAVRYWVRRAQAKRGRALPPYDSVWFERQATAFGKKYFLGKNAN